VVLLLINFNIDSALLEGLPILNGRYSEFTVEWFKNIGATLCFTVLVNTMSPHASKVALPLMTIFKRYRDRGYKKSLETDGKLNTKKVLQSELEALYLGPQIPTFFVFAQFFTPLLCVMTYSSGMPGMYPVACFNYFVIYWVYKVLIVRHYQKTTSFNEDMSKFTINFFRIGAVLHLVIGAFMYTNSSILSSSNIHYLAVIEHWLFSLFGEDHPFLRFGNGIGLLYFLWFLVVVFGLSLKKIGPQVFKFVYFFLCCN